MGTRHGDWARALEIDTANAPRRRDTKAEESELELTIAAFADLGRVGEVALLDPVAGGELSRTTPDFTPVGSSDAFPLADPALSRQPIRIVPRPSGGVDVIRQSSASPLSIDGVEVESTRFFDETRLASGLVLELASRIVLVLRRRARVAKASDQFGIIGESAEIQRVRAEIDRAAPLGASVLIRGETGTGKELVARALHTSGPRRALPFVAINMATVHASTAHSTLFGHVRGAFTGAEADRDGCFQGADGGVLFLDEIGELPSEVQPMLLRALESGTFQRLGSSDEERADVRVIAATDADLESLVARGLFRSALLHRLAGFEVRIPALRNRREDIARILVHYLGEELEVLGHRERLRVAKPTDPAWLGSDAIVSLLLYSWPGNVREVRNVARRLAVLLADRPVSAAIVETELGIKRGPAPAAAIAEPAPAPAPKKRQLRRKASTVSEDELEAALEACGWRFERTADMLGISRTALYGLIDQSDRFRKAKDLGQDELARAKAECGGDLDRMSKMLRVSKAGLRLRWKELFGAEI